MTEMRGTPALPGTWVALVVSAAKASNTSVTAAVGAAAKALHGRSIGSDTRVSASSGVNQHIQEFAVLNQRALNALSATTRIDGLIEPWFSSVEAAQIGEEVASVISHMVLAGLNAPS